MKLLIAIAAVSAALLIPAATASADPPGGGGYCVASATGCAAAPDAQCGTNAGSGAYGAFGNFGDVAHDFRGGANGVQTGLNNSALCGNRQGNLP